MQKNLQNLSLFLMSPFFLYTSHSFASSQPPVDSFMAKRVCVFDIDETLVFSVKKSGSTKTEYVQAPQAQAVIDLCLAENYGIAIATKHSKFRSLEDLNNLNFGEYNRYFTKAYAMDKNYTDVRNPEVNPIYIYHTHGSSTTLETRVANKSQAMDRIMRSYFGIGIGGSFVNRENTYLKQYMETHNNELPSDKDLSGCLVLFDDNPNNIEDILSYNMVLGAKFGAVKVTYDTKTKKGTGVTLENAEKAFKYMNEKCKS